MFLGEDFATPKCFGCLVCVLSNGWRALRTVLSFVFVATAGRAEHGTQYQLRQIYEHNLERTAYNMVLGGFGGVQGTIFP